MPETKEQSALIGDRDTSNAKNLDPEKETVHRRQVIALRTNGDGGDDLDAVVDARWYMARKSDGASPVYCSVWVSGHLPDGTGRYLAGHGRATGCGYCKQSAAFDEAVESAGIKLAARVDGAGMRAVDDAMVAIARALGYSRAMVVV